MNNSIEVYREKLKINMFKNISDPHYYVILTDFGYHVSVLCCLTNLTKLISTADETIPKTPTKEIHGLMVFIKSIFVNIQKMNDDSKHIQLY